MKILIQRVQYSSIYIEKKLYSASKEGLLLFIAFSKKDEEQDISKDMDKMIYKILNLKIFGNLREKKELKSVLDIEGEIMAVSQFTLYANTKKGFYPSYSDAMLAENAEKLYDRFLEKLKASSLAIYSGKFGEFMEVEAKNMGPYTLILETEK